MELDTENCHCQLTLKFPSHVDFLHPLVEPVELTNPSNQFTMIVNGRVETGELLIRSAIALQLTGQVQDPDEYPLHLGACLLKQDLLNPESPTYRKDISKLVNNLYPRGPTYTEEDACTQLQDKLALNAFIAHPPSLCLILCLGSMLNHSCVPNLHYELDALCNEASFTAFRDLEPTEELLICYTVFPIDSRLERALLLPFNCQCDVCENNQVPSLVLAQQLRFLPPSRHCWWCGGPAVLKCKGCLKAFWCSISCCRDDKAVHDEICSLISQLPSTFPRVSKKLLVPCDVFAC